MDVEGLSLFFFSILCQWLAHDRPRGPVFLWKERVGKENSIYSVWLHLTFVCFLNTQILPNTRISK